jgi:hypothetical protein
MTFPQYNDIINEFKKHQADEYTNDKTYIEKVMKEYYIDELAKTINKSKLRIIKEGYMSNVTIREEDRLHITNYGMLCETMNNFLRTNGFNFNTKLESSANKMYSVGETYYFCSFDRK